MCYSIGTGLFRIACPRIQSEDTKPKGHWPKSDCLNQKTTTLTIPVIFVEKTENSSHDHHLYCSERSRFYVGYEELGDLAKRTACSYSYSLAMVLNLNSSWMRYTVP